MGSRTPHPMQVRMRNIFLSMRVNRRNTTASRPIFSTRSCSLTSLIAANQLKRPLPRRGGACLSSACLARGAYTALLLGRRKQKARARRILRPKVQAREAKKEVDCIWMALRISDEDGGRVQVKKTSPLRKMDQQ